MIDKVFLFFIVFLLVCLGLFDVLVEFGFVLELLRNFILLEVDG